LGFVGAIISANEDIGDSFEYCSFNNQWNAYDCKSGDDFAVLESDAIGPDRLAMISSPVTLKSDTFSN